MVKIGIIHFKIRIVSIKFFSFKGLYLMNVKIKATMYLLIGYPATDPYLIQF